MTADLKQVDFPAFAELVAFLRRNGVLHYSAAGITLTLLPEMPVEPPAEEPKAPLAEPPKRGRDGQTREEQIDMFGRVMDPGL